MKIVKSENNKIIDNIAITQIGVCPGAVSLHDSGAVERVIVCKYIRLRTSLDGSVTVVCELFS